MEKLHFETFINAPVQKVWDTMLQDATYRQWTEPFHAGSYYKGSWEEGSEMQFLGPGEDGELDGGMFARIAKNIPLQFISIQHLGIIKDGQVDTESEEVKKWTPAYENYTFSSENGGTKLTIEVDTNEEYGDIFNGMWPKALEKLKELAEQ